MSTKISVQQKQQEEKHLLVVPAMVVAAMKTPACPAKLPRGAVPVAFAVALGITVTVSLLVSGSGTPANPLEFFFPLPPVAANLSAAVRPQSQQQQQQPELEANTTATIRSPSWPSVMDTSGANSTAQQAHQRVVGAGAQGREAAAAGGGGDGIMDVDDEELMKLAAAAPRGRAGGGAPKVAFLFLTRWDLPMAPLWEKFFEGHRGLYSVYVHTDPAFNGSDAGEGSPFHRRTIPSKEVKWGHVSMVEAERRLLAQALLDQYNARFLLLSESHVPLFDFPTVYSYLVNSTKSYLESYDQPGPTGRGRYKRGMAPVVTAGQWRKGSQWFEMGRELAADVVADGVYFPVFRRFCKRNCYADEHYLPTFLAARHPSAIANRSLTWVDWSHGGPHPARFTRMEVTPDFLNWLRSGAGTTCVYSNGETAPETTTTTTTTTVCFLFARKFLPNSLTRFLRFAPKVMGFG